LNHFLYLHSIIYYLSFSFVNYLFIIWWHQVLFGDVASVMVYYILFIILFIEQKNIGKMTFLIMHKKIVQSIIKLTVAGVN
jgi:hypothetical protein